MITKPVRWRDYFITEVKVYDASDWKGNLPPGQKDFENINVYQAVESYHHALEKHPVYPRQDERDNLKPWQQEILERICEVLIDKKEREFEEKVMQLYLDKYGMNQMIKAFGVNESELKEKLDRMQKEES